MYFWVFCRPSSRWAFREYNLDLKEKLGKMEKSDKRFRELTKQISGLQTARAKSAPSAEELAKHFVDKMSNGAEVYDNDWVPSENWRKKKTTMSSFRIRLEDVLKSLKTLEPSKRMNGTPNVVL